MQSKETTQTPCQLALVQGMAAANVVALIDESLHLLCQKRRTLEEKAICRYFCRLACAYGSIIKHLHHRMSGEDSVAETTAPLLYRLRTVNENVRNSVEELLKILKYDFNYLEQYFEYDYCARLLNKQELLGELEEIESELADLPTCP